MPPKIPGSVSTNRQYQGLLEGRTTKAEKAKNHAYLDWKKDSACFHSDEVTVSDFYYDDGRFGFATSRQGEIERQAHIKKLRRICAFCPVLEPCKELSKDEPFGFLAGRTEEERARDKSNAKKRAWKERQRLGTTRPQIEARLAAEAAQD